MAYTGTAAWELAHPMKPPAARCITSGQGRPCCRASRKDSLTSCWMKVLFMLLN